MAGDLYIKALVWCTCLLEFKGKLRHTFVWITAVQEVSVFPYERTQRGKLDLESKKRNIHNE